MNVDLSRYSNSWYKPGNIFKRCAWFITGLIFFESRLPYPNNLKLILLKLFGAKIGRGIVIKPYVRIKYPWFLEIGDYSWIGQDVWIDNLAKVSIGDNVCISQGAGIFTGNHNYKKSAFDLMVQPVVIEEGVWVGAKAIVCPGVTLKSHSVLSAGSVVCDNTKEYGIYQGNPASFVRERKIED